MVGDHGRRMLSADVRKMLEVILSNVLLEILGTYN